MDRYISFLLKNKFIIKPSSKIISSQIYTYGRFGSVLKNNLIELWKRSLNDYTYMIETPILTKKEVLSKSGHIKNFTEDIFTNLITNEHIYYSKTKPFVIQDHKIKIKNDRSMKLKEFIAPFKYNMIGDYTQLFVKQFSPTKIENDLLVPGKIQFVSIYPDYDLTFPFYGVVDPINEAPFLKKIYQHQGMLSTTSKPISIEDNMHSWNAEYVAKQEIPYMYEDDIYLRPETAQGVYCNYFEFLDKKLINKAFGISQVGRSFRNEIRMERIFFRCKEFDQMELQYFVPKTDTQYWYKFWVNKRFKWWKSIFNNESNLRISVKHDLAHYSTACTDIEYNFPWGWEEIEGIAIRNDFDLLNFRKLYDSIDKDSLHNVVETSAGVGRGFMALLHDAMIFDTEYIDKDPIMKFDTQLAPIKVAIATLYDDDKLKNLGYKIQKNIGQNNIENYLDKRNIKIGKKYFKADNLGVPKVVCLDETSLDDLTATIRDRDSGVQERIHLSQLISYIRKNVICQAINLEHLKENNKQ